MATVQDVMERVKTLLGGADHFDSDEIFTVFQNRYEELYETWNWSRRLRDFVITTVAQTSSTSTTTLTVTSGLATVTAIGTPFTSSMEGYQIQIGDRDEYFFFNYATTSTGTLEDGGGNSVLWPGDTDTAASWRIFKTLYVLPSDCASVIGLACDDYELNELDGGRYELDRMDPNRSSTDSRPVTWLYAGDDDTTSAIRRIEVWPVPTAARVLRGQYLRDAPSLTLTATIRVPTPVCVYATLADAFNGRYAKTGDESDQRQGLFYERKYDEVCRDYKPLERERTSPRHTIGRARHPRLGQDFYVNRHYSRDFE